MRTTLSIEADVARELESRMRREGKTLEELVNALLRHALRAGERPDPRPDAVRIETFASPFAPGIDAARLNRLNRLNDELEIAEFKRKAAGQARRSSPTSTCSSTLTRRRRPSAVARGSGEKLASQARRASGCPGWSSSASCV